MDLPKIDIEAQKLEFNLKFYFFLKCLVKAQLKESKILKIIELYGIFSKNSNIEAFKQTVLRDIPSKNKNNEYIKSGQECYSFLSDIFEQLQNQDDFLLFIFSLKLLLIKDLLLSEAKLKRASEIENLQHISPLSLAYDKITVFNPYVTRVNGALLSLAFFESLSNGAISQATDEFLKNLKQEAQKLMEKGVEPNQIFMLLFNESLNQSIKSDSGADYESRIKRVLVTLGIPEENISKIHDKVDASTEFDFFFSLNEKTYGISAKRTLRERYKQFIKTVQMSPIDVMIEITLGTDLTEEKMKAIVNHNVYLFVADEIYQKEGYLQQEDKVYSCKDLTLYTLKKLAGT